jgi:hypothetical protein
MRGSKKNSPTCAVCHGDMATSPAGKQAMSQASKMGAAKVKAAMQQRGGGQGMRPGMGGPMPQGARPGMQGSMGPGAPQGQPRIDPRLLQMLAAAAQQQRGAGGR